MVNLAHNNSTTLTSCGYTLHCCAIDLLGAQGELPQIHESKQLGWETSSTMKSVMEQNKSQSIKMCGANNNLLQLINENEDEMSLK